MNETELLGYGSLLVAAWLFGRAIKRFWQRFNFAQHSYVIDGTVVSHTGDPAGGELQRPVISYNPHDEVELCFVANIYRKDLSPSLPIGRTIAVRFAAKAPQQVELAGFMRLWGGVITLLIATGLALMVAVNSLPNVARYVLVMPPEVDMTTQSRLTSSDFARIAPIPMWWNEVEADVAHVDSYRELLDFWQSGEYVGDDREYYAKRAFKGFYMMILANEHNPDIVVPAIMLMDVVGRKHYPELDQLLQFALDNYYDYDKLIEYCTNCMVGDTVANIIESRSYGLYRQQPQQAMAIIDEFRSRRGDQVSGYMKARLAMLYASILQQQNQPDKALSELRQALQGTQSEGYRQQLERQIDRLAH